MYLMNDYGYGKINFSCRVRYLNMIYMKRGPIIEVCDSELDTLFIKDCYIDCLKLWWFSFSHDANYNASYKE